MIKCGGSFLDSPPEHPHRRGAGNSLVNRFDAAFPLNMSKVTDVPWAVKPQEAEAEVQRLIANAHPRKIILFGSYVRGETSLDSYLSYARKVESDPSMLGA